MPTKAQQQWSKAEGKARRERLELAMARLLLAFPYVVFHRQYEIKYADIGGRQRRFAIDFADPVRKVAIECNGGTWSAKSGHSSGAGIQRDYHRIRTLQLLGWQIIPFTSDEILGDYAIRFLGKLYGEVKA